MRDRGDGISSTRGRRRPRRTAVFTSVSAAPDGAEWLVLTMLVNDPKYLAQEFVTGTHFCREPNAAKWEPAPCKP